MRRFRWGTGVEGRSVSVLPVLAAAVTLTLSCRDVFATVNARCCRNEVRNRSIWCAYVSDQGAAHWDATAWFFALVLGINDTTGRKKWLFMCILCQLLPVCAKIVTVGSFQISKSEFSYICNISHPVKGEGKALPLQA
jgi:hypothetical protein